MELANILVSEGKINERLAKKIEKMLYTNFSKNPKYQYICIEFIGQFIPATNAERVILIKEYKKGNYGWDGPLFSKQKEKELSNLIDQVKGPDIKMGLFECNKCKKKRTTYYQMQTRSGDEAMCVFITCLHCGNKWKC